MESEAPPETTDAGDEPVVPSVPSKIENMPENTSHHLRSTLPSTEGRSKSTHLSAITGVNGETRRDYDFKWTVFIGGSAFAAVTGALMCWLMCSWAGDVGGVTLGDSENKKGSEINLHMVLMTVFMVYIQGLGTIFFRMLPTFRKLVVKWLHAGFHATALIGVSVGLYSAINHHITKDDPHFYTLHSWIGIIAIALFYVQFLAGLIVFRLYTPMRKSSVVVPYHHALGSFIFFASCIAAATGMMMKILGSAGKKYREFPGFGIKANSAAVLLLVFGFTITYLVSSPRFKRRPRPEA